ncbi:unnamed protein product [Closterium sp. NIES-53]
MTTLRVLLHVAAQRDYELHSLDFSTAFLQGSLHKEIWLRRPPGFTGLFPPGTQWSLRRPVYGLRQAPHEWHDTLRTTLAALGFAPSTTDPSLFLRTDTSLPPFYVLVYVDDLVFAIADTEALALVLQRFGFTWSSAQATPLAIGHSLLAPPSDESVEPSGPYPGTSGMGLVLGGQGDVVLTGHSDASWVDGQATQRSSQGYTFSLGSGSVSWRSTRAVLTHLPADRLGREASFSSNSQRGQLRLTYVATWANTADIFTKALLPGDHQCFCTLLGLVPTLPHLLLRGDIVIHPELALHFLTSLPRINGDNLARDTKKERVIELCDSLLFVTKQDAPIELWVQLVRNLAAKKVPGFPAKGNGTYYTT